MTWIDISLQQEYMNCQAILRQCYGIFLKNLYNHLSNKKKLLGQLVLPLIISGIFILSQKLKQQNPIVGLIVSILLKIYLGLIGLSALRELISLFITQRTQGFRQYQMIFGIGHRTHTLANLFYMGAYQSLFLLPFYLTLNYYDFDLRYILYFGAFVISSCTLTLFLSSFFKDHKIALEIIGMLFSLASFLPFVYEPDQGRTWLNILIEIIPNSAFTIAVLNKKTQAAIFSFACSKIYLLGYSIVQFPQYYIAILKNCCKCIESYLPTSDKQPTNLMQEFQLNEVVNSQLEHNSMTHGQRQIAIKAESLVKTYNVKGQKVNALNGVSLKIYQSQIFGLLGRNGAGKTTLVDILTGVTDPSQGSCKLSIGATIGICYQHEILYQNLTVRQHLVLYSHIKAEYVPSSQINEKIDEILSMLGIQGQTDKKSKELSGGNKRKLSVAIAILGRPSILIFDEPTSGLDPLSRQYVWQIFERLRKLKSTIILTTHHLDQAERLADWICVIEKGTVIVENTASKIKEKYGKGFHLQICKNGLQTFKQGNAQKYKILIEHYKLRAIQLQHLPNQLNFLLKPQSKQASGLEFERNFVQVLHDLQRQDLQLRFHSNTLEESFIAILRDQQNSSGDSLGQHTFTARQLIFTGANCSWLKKIFACFLRNLYYQKSNLMQALLLYNINIIIVLISNFFNSTISSAIGGVEKKGPSQPNIMMLLQGYTVMAAIFISLPVYQKQKKIIGVLRARGLGGFSYWFGTFLFDYSIYWCNLLIMGNFIAKREVEIVGWQALGLLGIASIIYSYVVSSIFQKVKTASSWFSVINMLMSFIIMPMILIGKGTVFEPLSILKYFYPFYDLTVASLFSGSKMEQLSQLGGLNTSKDKVIKINIAVYLVLLIAIQTRIYSRIKGLFAEKKQEVAQVIKLKQISKNYGNIEALKNVNYTVHQQRLALLGHNGAGKSTTFGLLSAQLHPNDGQLYLEHHYKQAWSRSLESAGICYQQDALWEGMLIQEVLSILSYIVPIPFHEREIKWLYQNLQFDNANTYKRFNNLSGGNKRKVCMMFALYGDPQIRLLDECSTGLDPSSRLAMVETIKHSRRGTTIFTTHSLSQAQDMCTKTVIMGKGQVLEFDYISNLRSKYFECSWIDLQIKNQMEETIEKVFDIEGISIIKRDDRVRLEISKKLIKKSELFETLIKIREQGIISSFSWLQPRLQDVYIKVTKQNEQQQNPSEPASQV